METVKDFLDAGLEFVDGDLCKDVNGAMLGAFWYQYLGQNEWMDSWYDGRLHEFAWRANTTGEIPIYKGAIELKYRGSEKPCVASSVSLVVWGNEQLLEWRPVISKMEDELAAVELAERVELASDVESLIDLDDDLEVRDALEKLQQESKPTYTKETHETAELKSGDNVYSTIAWNSTFVYVARHPFGGHVAVDLTSGSLVTIHEDHISAIPFATEEGELNKLIDELAMSFGAKLEVKLISHIASGIFEKGYRKP